MFQKFGPSGPHGQNRNMKGESGNGNFSSGAGSGLHDDVSAGQRSGVVVGKRDGLACVQVAGFVTLHYTGTTAPTVGECALAGDGKGGVAVTENAKKYRVLRVDTAAKTVGLYL